MAMARAPFSRRDAALEEVVLEDGRDLGVLGRQHLLAADTTSVTLAPNDENMWTNSTPVTPEPMTVTLVGKHLAAGSSRGW